MLILTINAKGIKMSVENETLLACQSFCHLSITRFEVYICIKLSLFVQIRTRLANYSVTQKERSKNEVRS